MDLMEYKAKELFDRYAIPGPAGFVVDGPAQLAGREVAYPVMVKAQVQIGGRGKAGGIKPAEDARQLEAAARAILGMDIKGHRVNKVLVVGQVKAAEEWYLSIALDRVAKCPAIIFSPVGGVDIEEVARSQPERIVRLNIDPIIGLKTYAATYLASKADVDSRFVPQLRSLLDKLYALFREGDCTLCEINPLAVTPDGRLQALDAKVTVDDSGLFRHPDLAALRDEMEDNPLIREGRKHGVLFIPCDPAGRVAVMSNGSGMIMSCIDILAKNGFAVCAGLDLGGGPTFEKVREATRGALSDPRARALFVNIFGGITRCNEVASGIKEYMEQTGSDKLVVVRFEGTNKEQGVEILNTIRGGKVVFVDGLYEGVAAIAERRAAL